MKSKVVRKRLDLLLVERRLADSTQKAQSMILAGEIFLDGERADKAGMLVPVAAGIDVHSRAQKYASRGGIKLEGALQDFHIHAANKTCLDVGASTGGFTDCLLQHGATRIYAVDVNVDQLAWKLRQDPRVTRIERNARELKLSDIDNDEIPLAVVDVSFIAVGKVISAIAACVAPRADLLILIKPQFELGRADVGAGGIVKDESLHRKAIAAVEAAAQHAHLECIGVKASHLTGAEGNQEYFLHARKNR